MFGRARFVKCSSLTAEDVRDWTTEDVTGVEALMAKWTRRLVKRRSLRYVQTPATVHRGESSVHLVGRPWGRQ